MLKKIFLPFLLLLLSQEFLVAQSYLNPKREFRGLWIATVYNIDWPKSAQDSIQKQKKDFENILDFHQDLNFNAVLSQVRAAGDVFYPTSFEPWARYLVGKEGQDPGYDPLAFMIQASHQRGLEFHAWFNPYRASMNLDSSAFDAKHVFNQHPEWLIQYGTRFYFNPGLPEVRRYVRDLIMEVVNKYDVDAIHFDDYFYPYKIKDQVFEDSLTFQKHGKDFEDIEDWRRANVDSLVKMIADSIQAVKPYVKFGISPFGVWRNRDQDVAGSDTQAGQTCFDDLYADPLSWMKNGWMDYIAPQLYWSIGFKPASHSTLVEWWSKNSGEVPVYIGVGAYKINNNADQEWAKADQVLKQISLHRLFDNIAGGIFFSAKSLMDNPLGVADKLRESVYAQPALIPLDKKDQKFKASSPPALIKLKKRRKYTRLFWEQNATEPGKMRYFLVYRIPKEAADDFETGKYLWAKIPYQDGQRQYFFEDSSFKAHKKYRYYLSNVNRHHQESEIQANW